MCFKNLIPVVLSGGSGKRLWPASRKTLPKQFKKFNDIDNLFVTTIKRAQKLEECNNLIIVSAKEYEHLIDNYTEDFNNGKKIILEESSKNTAAAIFFAAKEAFEIDENSVLFIMPSDHWIEDIKKFKYDIKEGVQFAQKNFWVVFGVKPKEPATSFGYIKTKNIDNINVKDVVNFIEKPDFDTAQKFYNSKEYFWNAGIFLVSAKKVLHSFQKKDSELKKKLENSWEKRNKKNKIKSIIYKSDMENLPDISIDKAILEHEQDIKLVPFSSNWSDVGNWDSMNALLKKHLKDSPNKILIDSLNTEIHSSERLIVGIGLEDLIVVDEKDTTLILKKGQSEKIKSVVEKLAKNNNQLTVGFREEYRPWGKFEVLLDAPECKVKRIYVDPFKSLSYQYHLKRSEHWTVVSGKAKVTLNNKKSDHIVGESIVVPVGVKHSLANNTEKELIIIEVQYGSYFGEDDIIRINDPYDR